MENEKNKSEHAINLFENIALTFSGGGYRASTFGLGGLQKKTGKYTGLKTLYHAGNIQPATIS